MKRYFLFLIFIIIVACEIRDLSTKDIPPEDISTYDINTNAFKTDNFLVRVRSLNSFDLEYRDLILRGFLEENANGSDETGAMFALRDVEIDYEMKYGAFKPEDRYKSKWIIPDKIEYQVISENEINLTLKKSDKVSGTFSLIERKNSAGNYLEISFKNSLDYNRVSLSFECDDEAFIGFGAQSIDVNHYGNELSGWVQEQGIGKVMHDNYDDLLWYLMGRRHSSQIPIPQILSNRNYIATIMDDIRPIVSLCADLSKKLRFEFSKGTSLYIFPGENPKDALSLATSVTGRSRIPPDFAFFPWIDAIFGSDNVRRIAEKIRENQIPATVIWTEDYKGATFRGDRYVLSENWNIDRTLYPDFEKLADDLHIIGYKFLLYFNSFVFEDSDVFSELDSGGLLIKNEDGKTYLFDGQKGTRSSLIDLLNEKAVNWLKDKMKDVIVKGADGWMGDFAEWLPTDAYLYDSETKRSIKGLLIHNRYPVLWQKIQREVLDAAGDNKERLFFVRSGWFGTPSLADVVWAGDQRTSFDEDDGLPTIIPIAIGLGISGISTYGHDIAGYQSVTNPPSDKELFFRWTELGAFSPIMRTHHGYMPRLNWSWESDEETISFFKKYATIHSQLFPYLKTLSLEANKTGIPIMRSLALKFPEDKIVWNLKDQYMLGESLLISPVVKRGELFKRVYLPKGRWALYNQLGNYVDGERFITIDAPLDSIPVFAKEGSIIPLISEEILTNVDIPNIYESNQTTMSKRIVKLFLGKDARFVEYNGTEYILKMSSSYKNPLQIDFKIGSKQINECSELKENCYIKDENGKYSVFMNANKVLYILMDNNKIATFEIKSDIDFDAEIRLFY